MRHLPKSTLALSCALALAAPMAVAQVSGSSGSKERDTGLYMFVGGARTSDDTETITSSSNRSILATPKGGAGFLGLGYQVTPAIAVEIWGGGGNYTYLNGEKVERTDLSVYSWVLGVYSFPVTRSFHWEVAAGVINESAKFSLGTGGGVNTSKRNSVVGAGFTWSPTRLGLMARYFKPEEESGIGDHVAVGLKLAF